jgi:hypothetical protein
MASDAMIGRALERYLEQVQEVKRRCGRLRSAGIEAWSDREIDGYIARIEKHRERCERGLTESAIERLSDDLDDFNLGSFSEDSFVEHLRGKALRELNECDALLRRVIDLVQG